MTTRFTTLAAIVVVALPIALLAQNAFSTVSGFIVDQSGAALPGVAVVAINTARGSRHEVSTDRSGRFELVGLTQGSYTLEAGLPGFETFEQKLTLRGEDVNREITLQLGSLQETVTVTNEPNGVSPVSSERAAPRAPNCGPGPARGGAGTRIGGQIRQPRKIRHVRPLYPEGVAPGAVTIDALIGIDGFVKETKVTNGAPDALARAAVDAVQQWEFDATLLNCEPVDVRMSVLVEFR